MSEGVFLVSPYGRTFIAPTQTTIFRGFLSLRSAHLMACMALRAFSFFHFLPFALEVYVSGQVPPLNYFETVICSLDPCAAAPHSNRIQQPGHVHPKQST